MAGGPGSVLAAVPAARAWAATRFPYLATAIFAASIIERDGTGTVTADDHWRVYVDPVVADTWTPAQLGSVLVHHAGHLLRGHADRARRLEVAGASTGWLAACDAEINDDLVDGGIDLPVETTLPEDLGQPRGQMAEQYYDPDRPAGERTDCGSVVDGVPRDGDDTGTGLDLESLRLLKFRVAADCQRLSGEPGAVPGSWQRWAGTTLSPRLPWERLLAAELRRSVAAAGARDYSYRRPSRRAGVVDGVVLPSMAGPHPELAIVLDTSGSMDADLLGRALAETRSILAGMGLNARRVPIIACDVVPQEVQRVCDASSIALLGGGGTDLRAGIEAACSQRPRPDVVVVLTDGRTPWPDRAPGPNVVVALVDPHGPPPPAWARSVRVDPAGR